MKLNEYLETYEPKELVGDITTLEKIPVDVDIATRTFERKEIKEGQEPTFDVDVIVVEGKEYAMKKSVLNQLKELLKEKPKTQFFKVTSKGKGLATEYFVHLI